MPNVNVFFSYSRKDYNTLLPLFIKFKTLLKTVAYKGQRHKIRYWHDENTTPGEHWDEKIKWELKSSDVVIFFVTSNFLISEYIKIFEIPIALERKRDSGIHLLPVLIEDCVYQSSKISHLQFIANKKGYLTPFTEWKNKKAFFEYVQFALKLSIINSLAGISNPRYFNPTLSPADKKKHIQYFAPPEIARLSKMASKKTVKKKKRKTSIFKRIKKLFLKTLKLK